MAGSAVVDDKVKYPRWAGVGVVLAPLQGGEDFAEVVRVKGVRLFAVIPVGKHMAVRFEEFVVHVSD